MAAWSVALHPRQNLLRRQFFWTRQTGEITGLLGRAPACLIETSELLANNEVAGCSSLSTNQARPNECLNGERSSSERRHQELLWRQFFLDQTLWWDNRHHKKGSRSPHFRHKESHEILWLNNFYKPAWVDAQLAALDMQMGGCAPSSNSSLSHDTLPSRSVGYESVETVTKICEQGQLAEAVEALEVLVQTETSISKCLFYIVLKKCVLKKDLGMGRRVHALTVKVGYEADTFLCNHILRMYASHARLREAMDVFTVIAKPDAFTWSSIISAHVKQGQAKQAIQLYHQMRRSTVKPDGLVFVAALQACTTGADLKSGQQVHLDLLASRLEPDLFLWNCLVNMYAKCGSLEDARRIFDSLAVKDVVTWNAMLAGYAQRGMGQEALTLSSSMQKHGITSPDYITFVCLLQACAGVGVAALQKGKDIHARVVEQGLQGDAVMGCSLVNMYAKCGSLEYAHSVFEGLRQKDVVTWTAMIAGYSQQGMGQQALHLYSTMQQDGIAAPNSVTFVCLLQACASVGAAAFQKGKEIHAEIEERGLRGDVAVGCSLVNMYAKCGNLKDARILFDGLCQKDVSTWTSMIAGYSQQGMSQEALHLYSRMQQEGITAPNSVTFVCLLQACASVGIEGLEKGKQLHAEIEEQGFQTDGVVGCSLVNMYAKCGSLKDAQSVFDGLRQKDVVTWNAMIAGYAQHGMGQDALSLYSRMQQEGIVALDSVTFVCLLQACASVAALHLGRQLHVKIEEQGLQGDAFVANSLINMYAKSGCMVDAQQVFDRLPERDIVAWNALIAGYTRQGACEVIFDLIGRMREDGVEPDGFTFLSLLTVCSHVGLVNKGQEYFEAMSRQYGITPTAEHYTCLVDLLGRAGQLDEALAVLRTIPLEPDDALWFSLLGACRKWGNVEVGRHAFDEAVRRDEKYAAAYVLMSNIYTGAQMWEEAQEMQARRKQIGAWKQPGQSWWTDTGGILHSFVVGDGSHPESEGIYEADTARP